MGQRLRSTLRDEAALEPAALFEHEPFLERLSRSLASDEHAARDLLQATWTAALERPPRHSGNLRAWLALVMRRTAARARRRPAPVRLAPEHEPAAPDAVDAAAERAHVSLRLAAALGTLDARQRELVVLRFYEGLALDAIAERLSLPAATVETRLRRALAHLRARLDADVGRRRWLAALVGLPLPTRESDGPGAPPARALRGLTAAAAVVAVGLVGRAVLRAGGEGEAVAAPPTAAADAAGTASLQAPGAGATRTPLATDPASAPTLAVHVVRPDGSPDPGAAIQVTDHTSGTSQLTTVGFADADGRFTLDLGPEHLRPEGDPGFDGRVGLHAVSRTRTPSPFTFVEPVRGELRLTVGAPGTVVRGRVRGLDGRPLAGALVTVGAEGALERIEGGLRFTIPRTVLAEADGSFAVHQVPHGAHRVHVTAEGWSAGQAWWSSATNERLDVVLTRGASLAGTVRDRAGAPAAGVRVWVARERKPGFPVAETVTASDGTYRLEHLPPGATYALAETESRERSSAAAPFTLQEGEVVDWSPTLDDAPALSLWLRDETWTTLGHWQLRLRNRDGTWRRQAFTDVDGQVTVRALPAEPLELYAFGPRVPGEAPRRERLLTKGLRGGPDVQIVEVSTRPPTASMLATLHDADGDVAAGAWLIARPLGARESAAAAAGADGAVALAPLYPGEYELRVFLPPLGGLDLGVVELADDEALAVGRVDLPPRGRLVVQGAWQPGERLELEHRAHGEHWIARVLFAAPPGPLPQLAGAWRATLVGPGGARARELEIPAHGTVALDLAELRAELAAAADDAR